MVLPVSTMVQGADPLSRIVVALVGLVVALRISDLALQVTLLGFVEAQQTWEVW